MASYNTVPDLESEAQPLAGAPPRKHGKATLAVVAALAFGAGALAPSAASRVSQMKMFQTYQGTKVAEDSQAMSTTGVGGDEVGYNAAVPIQTNAGTTNDGGETIRK